MTRSTLLKIGLAVGVALLVGWAALYLWFDYWVKTQREPPPALAAGLTAPYEQWPALVQRTFPEGTPEAVMVARLKADGFQVDPVAHRAFYDWKDFPCIGRASVEWSAGDGRVTRVDGDWQNVCP